MTKYLILVVIWVGVASCNSFQHVLEKSEYRLKPVLTLDTSNFQFNIGYNLDSKISFYLYKEPDGFYEEKRFQNTLFTLSSSYYKNLKIKSYSRVFSKITYGIGVEYDYNGHIINHINYDLGYKLSLKELAKLLYKKYSIDISEKPIAASRYIDDSGLPVYYISYSMSPNHSKEIKINANNGNIILEKMMIGVDD